MSTKVALYIAEHNQTGLKYFGKTVQFYTEEDLQKYYHGSGKYWVNHLKKHGNDVTMKIYGVYDSNEVEEVALKFSEENDIVNSKGWANLKPENGKDGWIKGYNHSDKTKIKISEKQLGRILSEEHKEKLSKAAIGHIKSEEHRKNLSLANKGKKLSDETKRKVGLASKGRKQSEESKEKISKVHKGKPKSKESNLKRIQTAKNKESVICPYCKKEGHPYGMKRWHFDNCKSTA